MAVKHEQSALEASLTFHLSQQINNDILTCSSERTDNFPDFYQCKNLDSENQKFTFKIVCTKNNKKKEANL